jgi:hypothetical protein
MRDAWQCESWQYIAHVSLLLLLSSLGAWFVFVVAYAGPTIRAAEHRPVFVINPILHEYNNRECCVTRCLVVFVEVLMQQLESVTSAQQPRACQRASGGRLSQLLAQCLQRHLCIEKS